MRALTTVALLAAMASVVRAASPARESAAALQFFSTQDIDEFYGVFCTDNWFFLDAAGQRHAWSEMRGQAAKLLAEPRATSISQPISKVSPTREGAVALVTLTTVHDVVDDEGRYGRKGPSHADRVHEIQRHVGPGRRWMEAAVP